MKKIIILLCFIFLKIGSNYCQEDNKLIFNGLGVLKVNITTTEVIKELETILNTKNREIDKQEIYSYMKNVVDDGTYKKPIICQLILNTKDKKNSPFFAPKCPLVKYYFIKGYKVSDIELVNLELEFYEDTLVEIKCTDTKELTDAIKLKYGEGEIKIEKKEIKCTYTYNGNSISYEEISMNESWRYEDIHAMIQFSKYYNSDCKERTLTYISIRKIGAYDLKSKCEKEITDLENQEKLKKLKDL